MDSFKQKTCYSCRRRHNCRREPPIDGECENWKMGDCYACKFINADEEDWIKRGCECWCFGGCKKYKRNWKKFFKILFKNNKKKEG